MKGIKAAAVFLAVYAMFSISGFLFPVDREWYDALNKPSWTPSGQTIGIIWACLFALIAASITRLYVKIGLSRLSFTVVSLLTANYVFNQAFSFIQFDLKQLFLAFIDTLLVAFTCLWIIYALRPLDKWASYLYIPYFLWSCFATFLAWSIFYMN
ncbi:TspO/MBR family protein [Fictibacillus iocasae]|uniref:TspO/MBR family protein n=1 Tax=Fictibacillus iocasae TaxID=2715437 RepID=A0ABW2NR34_9BACL